MALKSLRTTPPSRAQQLSRDDAASEGTLRAAFKESATHRRADAVTEDSWADIEASIDAAFAALDQLEQAPPAQRRKGPPALPAARAPRKQPPPLPQAKAVVATPEPTPALPAAAAPLAQPRTRRRRRAWPYGVAVLLLALGGSALWLRLTHTPLSVVLQRVQAALQR